ncbi:MAG: helix-turn-helix transcriptional regulator, partial [Segatella oris]
VMLSLHSSHRQTRKSTTSYRFNPRNIETVPKEVLNSFKEKDPERKYAAAKFSLLRLISAKEHDVKQTSRYADSVEVYQEKEIESISETKNRYYAAMLQKEELRKKFQNESQMKTVLLIVGICFSVLIIASILYITWLKQKHTQIIHQEKQHLQQLELEHKEQQITTMREFMMKKINILQKLTSIQPNNYKHVLLSDSDWEELEAFLNSSDNEFVMRLTNEFPLLTKKDIRFLMLIRIRLPYQIIAQILSIEPKSVRQRLFLIKAKLGLKSNQQSTKKFIEDY